MRVAVAEIRSGVLGDPPALADYRSEWLGDMLIERRDLVAAAEPLSVAGRVIAGEGYIWFRFWLRQPGVAIERYYAPAARRPERA